MWNGICMLTVTPRTCSAWYQTFSGRQITRTLANYNLQSIVYNCSKCFSIFKKSILWIDHDLGSYDSDFLVFSVMYNCRFNSSAHTTHITLFIWDLEMIFSHRHLQTNYDLQICFSTRCNVSKNPKQSQFLKNSKRVCPTAIWPWI